MLLAPPLSWLLRKINQLFRRYSARIQASMGDITRVTKEGLDGQRVIKAFNAQDYEIRQFDEVNERNRRSFMRLIGTKSAGNPVVQVIASLGLAVVLYFAVRQVIHGSTCWSGISSRSSLRHHLGLAVAALDDQRARARAAGHRGGCRHLRGRSICRMSRRAAGARLHALVGRSRVPRSCTSSTRRRRASSCTGST